MWRLITCGLIFDGFGCLMDFYYREKKNLENRFINSSKVTHLKTLWLSVLNLMKPKNILNKCTEQTRVQN